MYAHTTFEKCEYYSDNTHYHFFWRFFWDFFKTCELFGSSNQSYVTCLTCHKYLIIGITKTILHNVSGHFEPGKISVIIGPSGAGKTTMLKILSGERLLNVKGTIAINGVQNRGTIFRKQMCYVPQQFSLLPFLTTKETLYFAARFKLNVKQSKQEINLTVSEENLEQILIYIIMYVNFMLKSYR